MDYQIIIDDYIGYWGYSKNWLRNTMKSYKDKHVNMLISSLGGSVDDALDMYQQLREHGDVTVYLSGFVASAATIIALGANRVVMSKNCLALFHKCSGSVNLWGSYNADEIATAINTLEKLKRDNDKIDAVIANIYQDKCKNKCDIIGDIITAAEWHDANECLAWGFVDEIGGTSEKSELTDHIDRIFTLNDLPKVPTKFRNHVTTGSGITAFVSRISDELKSFLSTNTIAMAKQFLAVGKVIGCDNFAIADGAKDAKLTEEQLNKLDSKLLDQAKKEKDDAEQISNLQNDIKTKDAKIEELSKLPGVDVYNSAEEDDNKVITAQTMYNEVKDYL